MKKKTSVRSRRNDAGMATAPCKSPSDRPDAVEQRPRTKSFKTDQVQVEESPDGLPEGWIIEFRPRKRGQRIDKYYINPVLGYGLLSKMDVYRYLQNKEEFQIRFRIKRIHTTDFHSTIDESIPILRLKNRNRSSTKELVSNANILQIASSSSWDRHASTESDECHLNPEIKVKGCNKQITDDNLQTPDNKHHSKPSVLLEGRKLEVKKTDKEPVRKSKRLASSTIDIPLTNDAGKSSRKPKSQKFEQNMQATVLKELHGETLRKANTDDAPDENDAPASVEIQAKLQKLESSADHASQNPTIGYTRSDQDENISEEKQNQSMNANKSPQRKIKNTETKPARASKWLAGADNDPLSNSDIEKVSINSKCEKLEQSMQQTVPKELHEGKLHIANETSQKSPFEECTHSSVAPPRLIIESWPDPCIEFAFKTLTSDFGIEDKHRSGDSQEEVKNLQPCVEQASQNQAFVEWRPDPSIEFAFKTLTSDLNVEEEHITEGAQEKLENKQSSVEQASQKQQYADTFTFKDCWSDPCLEFAFKTLTSDFF